MFLQQARSARSYSTWHPQVLLLKKIPLTSPNVQPCQSWSSILRSLPVVVVSRPHCHRLNWALCNRPPHIHIPIKKLVRGSLFMGDFNCKYGVILAWCGNQYRLYEDLSLSIIVIRTFIDYNAFSETFHPLSVKVMTADTFEAAVNLITTLH